MASPMRDDGTIRLVFDQVSAGLGSTYLSNLTPGETLNIISCMGNFVLPSDLQDNVLFIARYTGIVPILAMLTHLDTLGFSGRVHLIYSSPTREEVFFEDELSALSLPHLTTEFLCLDAESEERPEEECAAKWAQEIGVDTIRTFICGVSEMVRPVRKALLELGMEKAQIRSERFN
jgi:ferredoxin-NADP reductase